MNGNADGDRAASQPAPSLTAGSWHLQDAFKLARRHGIDPQQGLPDDEAGRRAEQHGPNEITGRPSRSLLGQFIDQLNPFSRYNR